MKSKIFTESKNYIKKFQNENHVNNTSVIVMTYWKIPTKEPNIIIALNKIEGCPLKLDNVWYKENRFELDYVYVIYLEKSSYNWYEQIYYNWRWLFSDPQEQYKIREFSDDKINHKINKGEITVSDKEIEQYELEQISKKYNL